MASDAPPNGSGIASAGGASAAGKSVKLEKNIAGMSLEAINEELANVDANLARDIKKLEKVYERRRRALRAARAAKTGGADAAAGAADAVHAPVGKQFV